METSVRGTRSYYDLRDISDLLNDFALEVEKLEEELQEAKDKIDALEIENGELQGKIKELESNV